jgi:hypothetical protein
MGGIDAASNECTGVRITPVMLSNRWALFEPEFPKGAFVMLRRVTTLAALDGGRSQAMAEAGSIRRLLGVPFTEVNRRRHSRSSACTALAGLSWDFDPPATSRRDDRPVLSDLSSNHFA